MCWLSSRNVVLRPGLGTVALAALMALAVKAGASCRAAEPPDEATQAERRKSLVEKLGREITDRRVLRALAEIPRHRFVPAAYLRQAYRDHPLPIGHKQTISQPYIVAYMTQSLRLRGHEKVLEVGTGSGYQAAVLSRLAEQVYSVEIIAELSARAARVLAELGARNVHLRVGDGFDGWPQHAPYHAIIVTAAPLKVPPALITQLKEGGRLVIPLGPGGDQHLKTYRKQGGKLVELDDLPVRFVPMTGKAARQ